MKNPVNGSEGLAQVWSLTLHKKYVLLSLSLLCDFMIVSIDFSCQEFRQ